MLFFDHCANERTGRATPGKELDVRVAGFARSFKSALQASATALPSIDLVASSSLFTLMDASFVANEIHYSLVGQSDLYRHGTVRARLDSLH